ncbi:CCA tRNA nucleotidyltransferase 1, mitochondrial-like isoform X2 [Vespa mandarinia]|uniref:CCA tRNA nucleotidyltransferase 1, mitochondrial-like isoform X2 n=1 Tax=Vespa mandarinia TaxID=7446 RepID=UPI00160E64E6|nr:CCA tRNA nucleotidyltransferase 1, mitochondrial-like isoform X2 [Vespa mandarinia]
MYNLQDSKSKYLCTNKSKRISIRMENEALPPSRDNPIITKLDGPIFHSIFTPELNILSELFKKYNYTLRITGGAIRDILMDVKPIDLDFATTATPEQMKDLFTKEQIRMINTKGEKHGTITARINDKENFEITTLRIDLVTDGRHAEVQFVTDWKLDANRRDLTINSMFLDLEGNVYDYFYGYDDLKKRRIVFVGNPTNRIREDYLRILRYFRFYGRITNNPVEFDENTIKAIKENISGLQFISGERIWSEWKKILDGRYGGELMLKMIECGAASYIGLPKELDVENFKNVYYRALNNSVKLHAITLITSLLKDEEEVMILHKRLKLSVYERNLALFLIQHREAKPCEKPLRPYQLLIINSKLKISDTKEFVCEVLKYRGMIEFYNEINKWIIPKFPINGHMIKSYVPHPRMVGPVLYNLKEIWFDKDFKISLEELIKHIEPIIHELNENKK